MKSVLNTQSKHMIAWPTKAMIVSLCTQNPSSLVVAPVQFNDTRINRNEAQLM